MSTTNIRINTNILIYEFTNEYEYTNNRLLVSSEIEATFVVFVY